jgi:hypothetical protein
MVDVVRVPDEPTSPFAASRKKRRAGLQKIKSESVGPDDITTHHAPEDGWDDKTRPNGIVYSYTKNKDCERAVVCTKKMATLDVEDQAGDPNSFQFQRVVKDSDFIAGGIMHIPVGGGKPLKPAKDNFYVGLSLPPFRRSTRDSIVLRTNLSPTLGLTLVLYGRRRRRVCPYPSDHLCGCSRRRLLGSSRWVVESHFFHIALDRIKN